MAEHRYLAVVHPEWIDFLNHLPPNTKRVPITRDHLPITPQPGLDIQEFSIPARDGHPICVRAYKQPGHENFPLLTYLHGGGFVTGGFETDDASCRELGTELPILVLNVEYRLAPENPFPTGFEDSFDVVRWAGSRGTAELPINLQRDFLLGGTSAGANFTAGIAHLA
ncbi:hypothetical protein N7492_010615 [Penicillium capsulatum]|uniref:Alpha/beta hydrolase fold-3 domain-containing protein n=1 Tax=Penicillium capsulatum TaxID=69766 RepID=A0A9W9HPH7_9EURO|nr:hypothetical protein N7492_010615 [Penicillium capsulatum]KAJ6113114.1 hypothetical protein N7512_008438 [Penicillium capsulatum]